MSRGWELKQFWKLTSRALAWCLPDCWASPSSERGSEGKEGFSAQLVKGTSPLPPSKAVVFKLAYILESPGRLEKILEALSPRNPDWIGLEGGLAIQGLQKSLAGHSNIEPELYRKLLRKEERPRYLCGPPQPERPVSQPWKVTESKSQPRATLFPSGIQKYRKSVNIISNSQPTVGIYVSSGEPWRCDCAILSSGVQSLVSQSVALGQRQHRHHLGAGLEVLSLRLCPDLLPENLYFNKTPAPSDVRYSLRSIVVIRNNMYSLIFWWII